MIWAKLSITDKFVIVMIAVLSLFSCLMLYSAGGGNIHAWALKQFMRFTLGFIIMLAVAHINLRFWRNNSYLLYLISLILLIFVEFKGHIGMGAQRWVDLYFIKLQPSELMKLTLIMALAQYFNTKNETQTAKLVTYLLPLLLITVPCILVLRQPDLGTMIILMASGVTIIFAAGIKWWKILTAFGAIIASLPLFWLQMHTYQKNRVINFLHPENDPLGSGYHVIQSKIAIGSGGFWGKGLLNGTQSQLDFLPEKHTDFIFAMLCEELGMFGGITLIIIFAVLLFYIYNLSNESSNAYGKLFAIGFAWLLFLYIFVNIGMVMGVLPVVGVPLPFMSYGGSSIMTLLMGFGLLLCISINKQSKFTNNF